MAGTSMNDIKARIKSVESTRQITKAMELVATSKLRRARESVERTRPFYEALGEAIDEVFSSEGIDTSGWTCERDGGKTLYIVIAGDRGLAGGYNSNIFKLAGMLDKKYNTESLWLPIGKKALEYYRRREAGIVDESYEYVANTGVGEAMAIGEKIAKLFREENIARVVLVYTRFVSMLTQTPVYEQLLPLEREGKGHGMEMDGDPEEMLESIIPEYLGGIIYSALAEASASESGARRSAMSSANKNASEMIDDLMLKFNRARQAVITQEITEIVSGAEAL